MATTLLDLVRQRRIELEASLGSEAQISDERRIAAIMALAAKCQSAAAGCAAAFSRGGFGYTLKTGAGILAVVSTLRFKA